MLPNNNGHNMIDDEADKPDSVVPRPALAALALVCNVLVCLRLPTRSCWRDTMRQPVGANPGQDTAQWCPVVLRGGYEQGQFHDRGWHSEIRPCR